MKTYKSHILANIGRIYQEQEDYEKAIEYYHKARVLQLGLGDDIGLSNRYHSLGSAFALMNQSDSAMHYLEMAIDLKRRNNDLRGIAELLDQFGELLAKSGDFSKAKENYDQALQIRQDMGDKEGTLFSFVSLAELHYSKSEFEQSVELGNRAFEMAEELGLIEGQKQAADVLYRAYSSLGKSKAALQNYELHIQLRDSVLSESNQRALLRNEYKYTFEKQALTDSLEFSKREAVMTEKSEKQQLGLFAAGGGFTLLLLLAFTIYRGKKESDKLLLNILPYETAQELKKKGTADAKLIDEVTVLFTDFKGFTAMSEQLSPKALVEDLNLCFSEFDRIMERHGIEKIKTIGDAYMAACGLPSPNPEHSRKVIEAAFEMRDFVEAGKQRKIDQGLPYFEIRIGVHTGPVVAGIVGIKKFQYDIWGDTVNTASRMESSGEVGKVNISDSTYQLVKDQFACEYRGEIEAKGKGKVKMYFVDRIS